MTPQELKNSILQLAIQGKLVEQRAEEGTGKELLEKILAAKNAEGAKGKGEKSHAKSAKSAKVGSRVSHEEIPDDEKPFDIPESWEWVRLGEVGSLTRGSGIKRTETRESGYPCIRYGELYTTYKIRFSITKSFVDEPLYDNAKKISNGDIVMTLTGENKTDIATAVVYEGQDEIAMGGDMTCWSHHGMESLYLVYLMNSPYAIGCKRKLATGDIIVHISNEKLSSLLLPLPPLAEQKRIVAKIEELLPLVERYEKAWSKLKDFNKRFPADMQKSLLQMAIQGKLVEQRADEGTGRELLEEILAAKNAEGAKGKGEKSHSKSAKSAKVGSRVLREEIPDDEKPFDIPKNWEWVRLEDLVIKDIKRGKSPTYTQKSGTLVFAQKCNTKSGVINLSLALFLDEAKLSKYPESEFMRDCDIVINSTGNGTLGRVGIYRDSDNPNKLPVVPDSHVTVIRVGEKVSVEYVFYGLKHYQPLLEKLCSGSTNQTELSASTVKSLLFPLPPLAEQKRIVAKLEELLLLCERLK